MQLQMPRELGPERETSEEIFARVFNEYRPRTPLAAVRLAYKRYANANSAISFRESRLEVRLSDLWQGAPAKVVEALAHILIAKMFRRTPPQAALGVYRRWLSQRDVRRSLELVKQVRGRKFISGATGAHWDLQQIFARLFPANLYENIWLRTHAKPASS